MRATQEIFLENYLYNKTQVWKEIRYIGVEITSLDEEHRGADHRRDSNNYQYDSKTLKIGEYQYRIKELLNEILLRIVLVE